MTSDDRAQDAGGADALEPAPDVPPRPTAKPPAAFVKVFKAGSERAAMKLFEAHARNLRLAGYIPLTKSWAEGGASAISVMLLGWLGTLARDDGKLTVTYIYRPDITGPPTRRLRTPGERR